MDAMRVLSLAVCAGILFTGSVRAGTEAEPAKASETAMAPVPFDPNAIAGRDWHLVALPGADEVPVPAGTRSQLRFEAEPDGSWKASGYGPCNAFSTPAAFVGNSVELASLVATKRACAELALETAWFDRMRAGKADARLEDDRLELSRDGVAVMVFEAGPGD